MQQSKNRAATGNGGKGKKSIDVVKQAPSESGDQGSGAHVRGKGVAAQLLADTLSNLEGAVGIWNADDALIAYNADFKVMFSAFPDIRLGKTIGEYLLGFAKTGAIPEIRGKEEEWVNERLIERTEGIGKQFHYQTHDGKWISRIDKPMPGGGLISLRKDVTREKLRDEQVDSQGRELELTFAAMNDLSPAILVRDRDLKYRIANKAFAEMYGKSLDDIIGRDAVELFGEETAATFDPGNLEVIETGKPYQVEELLKFPDGREVTCFTEVKQITDSKGEKFACITITDISALREREAVIAEKSNKLALNSAILKHLSPAVLVKDKNLRYTMVNPAFCSILGKTEEELIGNTTLKLFGEERSREYDGREQKVIETGELLEFEETFTHADGKEVSAITRIQRIVSEDGEPYACVTVTDVTELSKLNSDLQMNKERFKAFAETNSDWFWEMDKDLRFSFFSESFEQITGVSPEKLLGKTRRETGVPGVSEAEFNDHLAVLDMHDTFRDFVHSRTRENGDTVWLSINGIPIFDANGNFHGYLGSGRDVTDIKTREIELEQANSRSEKLTEDLQKIIDSLDLGIVVVDSNLRTEMINYTFHKIWKTDAASFAKKAQFRQLMDINRHNGIYNVPDDGWENYVTMRLEGIRKGNIAPVELRREDGVFLLYSVTNLSDDRRLISYFDITEQKQREQEIEIARAEAQMADRAKSEFLANMSHEIRTPMNGVMGMAELLAKTDLNAKQKMFTDVIVKSGASLLTIINDILDFSKLDAGQMELDPAPFKLAEAIEDVATLVSSRVAEKDLELIVRIDPQLPEMMVGDVGRIRQIVTNLMGNAVKFTEAGHVFVNVKPVPGAAVGEGKIRLRFEVEDTGIGIPEDKCAAVFEKFSQVDTSSSRKHEGTGLGLTIASSLVEIMGGRMGVHSEVGVGSTFWFEMELPTHGNVDERKRVPMDVSGARILIVDDNAVNRSILTEQMMAWQFDSAAAVNGEEALAVMRAALANDISIDCVVLDYHMPGMNGGDVVKAMRTDPILADISVIMLTSVDQTEDGRVFSSLGIQRHLTKPARSSHLLETIISVLEDANFSQRRAETKVFTPVRNEASKDNQAIGSNGLTAQPSQSADLEPSNPADFGSTVDILVCEDNEVNQIVFTQILESAGYNYRIAPNGKVGVEMAQKFKPQLVLMDVSMPEMNGLQATAAIREMEEGSGRRTPIIGVTAHAIKGDMEKCLAAGMDDYLSKPVSPDALQKKIDHWMMIVRNTRRA